MFTINEQQVQKMNTLMSLMNNSFPDKDYISLLNKKPFEEVEIQKCNTQKNLPIKNSTILRVIKCRIEFLQIGEVDTMNERYQATVKIKAKWYEDEIITEYDKNKYWNPKLFIENALHEKFYEEISYSVQKDGKGTIVTQTMVSKGSFWERMELVSYFNKSNKFIFDIIFLI
jgi:hypothetical protein